MVVHLVGDLWWYRHQVPSINEVIPMPRAFITGITGQDGQHLAEFLHAKGYQVFGMLKGQNNPRALQIRDELSLIHI